MGRYIAVHGLGSALVALPAGSTPARRPPQAVPAPTQYEPAQATTAKAEQLAIAQYKVQWARLLLEAYRAGVMPTTLPAPGTAYDARGRPVQTERARDFLWRVAQDPYMALDG